MCRFVAYIGNRPLLIKTLLQDTPHSLITQSHSSKETISGVNADGFGVGWYDLSIDEHPAIFRSVLPAWNDENLINIASKVKSTCFIGHIRESTIGAVGNSNCHPFSHERMLFAHNGTIEHFGKIKRDLINCLDQLLYDQLNGQTDSEHFFLLWLSILYQNGEGVTCQSMTQAMEEALRKLNALLSARDLEQEYRINSVLTTGKEMLVTRFIASEKGKPHSLYYSCMDDGVVVASERLTDELETWTEVPNNYALQIDQELNISTKLLKPI